MSDADGTRQSITFFRRALQGVDPASGQPLPLGSPLTDTRVTEHFRRALAALESVDAGEPDETRVDALPDEEPLPEPPPEPLPMPEEPDALPFDDTPAPPPPDPRLAVVEKVEAANELLAPKALVARWNESLSAAGLTPPIPEAAVQRYLYGHELLMRAENADGVAERTVTEAGRALGFMTERRRGRFGMYTFCGAGAEAQRYLASRLSDILGEYARRTPAVEKPHSRSWTQADDKALQEAYHEGFTATGIALQLERTPIAVRTRLVKLGMIGKPGDFA